MKKQTMLVQVQQINITGHRGAAGLVRENTLSAVHKGLEWKCDRIEIDVHQTADSMIVLMHDETIDRVTNGKGKIKNLTYEQLLRYSVHPLGVDDTIPHKIPLLEDVLKAVNGKSKLVIELKEGDNVYPQIEYRVVSLIRKYKAEKWCIIHSFREKVLDRVHEIALEIPLHKLLLTGFLNGDSLKSYVTEVSVFSGLLTKSFIDKVHKAGKKINVWTVNNKEQMTRFIELGVDGIITDYPDLAKELIAELKEKSKSN